MESLEQRQSPLPLLTCRGERADQVIKRAHCLFQSHGRFEWGCHGQMEQTVLMAYFWSENTISFVVCMLVLVVIQRCFCMNFSWISIRSQYDLVDAALQQQDIGAIPGWYTGQPWACELRCLFLSFPIHKSGSGTHWFAKVLWDPQEKNN